MARMGGSRDLGEFSKKTARLRFSYKQVGGHNFGALGGGGTRSGIVDRNRIVPQLAANVHYSSL